MLFGLSSLTFQARKRGSDDAMGAWKWGAPGGPAEV